MFWFHRKYLFWKHSRSSCVNNLCNFYSGDEIWCKFTQFNKKSLKLIIWSTKICSCFRIVIVLSDNILVYGDTSIPCYICVIVYTGVPLHTPLRINQLVNDQFTDKLRNVIKTDASLVWRCDICIDRRYSYIWTLQSLAFPLHYNPRALSDSVRSAWWLSTHPFLWLRENVSG